MNKLQKEPSKYFLIIKKILKNVFTTGAIIASVTYFLTSNFYQQKIEEVEASISRLPINLINNNSIDLSKYFIKRGYSTNENIPVNSIYDKDNMIYYSPSKYWKHKRLDQFNFLQLINEEDIDFDFILETNDTSDYWFSDYSISFDTKDYLDLLKLYKSYDLIKNDSLEMAKLNYKPKKLFQYIKVTRYNNDISYYYRRNLADMKAVDSVSFSELGFKNMILDQLTIIIDHLENTLPFYIGFNELTNISMNDNWFFLSSISTFGKKSIINNITSNIYCFKDWYFFYTEKFFYILEIQTPSFEPIRRGKQFVELNKWLSYFKIVTY